MKCDICGQEVANSEAMKAHMEREHTPDKQDDDELEAPDLLEKEENEEQEQPEAVARPAP